MLLANDFTHRLTKSQVDTLFELAVQERPVAATDLVRGLSAPELQARLIEAVVDLKRPVLEQEKDTPLSLSGLLDLNADELEALKSMSFLDVLMSPTAPRHVLEAIIVYSEQMTDADLPEPTRFSGMILNSVASLRLSQSYHVPLLGEASEAMRVLELLMHSDAVDHQPMQSFLHDSHQMLSAVKDS